MSSRRRRSRGQAMVEFALVAPIFFIVLFGIIDMARYVYTLNTLQQVARESARVGSVPIRPVECTTSSRVACVKTVAIGRAVAVGLTSSDITVTCEHVEADGTRTNVTDIDGECAATDMLVVNIQTNFTLVTPLIAQFINGVGLTGEARMTVNQ
jgi:hypothetical protein